MATAIRLRYRCPNTGQDVQGIVRPVRADDPGDDVYNDFREIG